MRSKNLLLALLAGSASLAACGRQDAKPASATYFVPRSALSQLGDSVKVVGTHDSGLLVEAPQAASTQIKAVAPESFRFDQWQPEHSAYDYNSMEQKINALAAAYPSLVKVDTYGTSVQGRKEYVLTISNQNDKTPHPQLMITGATHGNEIATVDVVLGLAERMLQGYGTDARFTAMINTHTFYIVPAVCVDSYVAQTRANEGTDPNRSYPYPDDLTGHPTHAILDMIAFVQSHDVVGSIDYHSAASMIMFPWAYTYDKIPTADYQLLDQLTTTMAATNGFAHGDIADTIYVAAGSSADYWYWKHHTLALGIEISHDYATSNDPSDLIQENAESTWTFVEHFR